MKTNKLLASFIIPVLALTGCGNNKTSEEPGSKNFTFTTDLEEEKEIHTDAQLAYLEYDGEYKTIDPNLYPEGKVHNSAPLPVDIEWNYTMLDGKEEEFTNFTVSYGQFSDLSDGFIVEAETTEDGGKVSLMNVFMGTNYFKVYANYSDGTEDATKTMTFNVKQDGPRNLEVDGFTNCRDMGGRVLPSGGTIRQGLIYRTCGNGYNQDGQKIDQEGTDILTKQLKVKSEIVLHNDDGFNFDLPGTTVYKTYMDYDGGKHHFSRNTENVINVFKILADKNNYPVYYHCRIGTDRTGLVAILVNGLLGVELNEIYQDYLFSNFGKIGKKRYIGSQAGDDDISVYVSEIEAAPGNTFQEKVYNVLLSIGVTKETLAAVLDNLIEGTKPVNDNGQVSVSPDKMTLDGTTVASEDKSSLASRTAPEHSVVMSTGATATATFNVTKAGAKALYAYVGNSDQSTSKTIGASISATIDGNVVTIPSLTFKEAGFGTCRSRTNYYFVKLGDVGDLSVGQHTVVVTGVANNIILGNLALVG